MLNRRTFAKLCVAASGLLLPQRPALGQRSSCSMRRPNTALLQAGDLLWTKLPGVPIPHGSGSADETATGRAEFDTGRAAFEQLPSIDADQVAFYEQVRRLTNYAAFRAAYFGNGFAGTPQPHGSAAYLVGHIAIVDKTSDGRLSVIEAVKPAVQRVEYNLWEKGREGQAIWHARLERPKDDSKPALTAGDRAKIANEAARHIGRGYDLWRASAARLDDTTGFYCSKLVWLSVLRAVDIAIDDFDEPKRKGWITPKQVLSSRYVVKLNDPGEYSAC
jgi:hypothetical protein